MICGCRLLCRLSEGCLPQSSAWLLKGYAKVKAKTTDMLTPSCFSANIGFNLYDLNSIMYRVQCQKRHLSRASRGRGAIHRGCTEAEQLCLRTTLATLANVAAFADIRAIHLLDDKVTYSRAFRSAKLKIHLWRTEYKRLLTRITSHREGRRYYSYQ